MEFGHADSEVFNQQGLGAVHRGEEVLLAALVDQFEVADALQVPNERNNVGEDGGLDQSVEAYTEYQSAHIGHSEGCTMCTRVYLGGDTKCA